MSEKAHKVLSGAKWHQWHGPVGITTHPNKILKEESLLAYFYKDSVDS